MTAMLPPIIGGIQAAFGVGTKMCFTIFTMQNFANFLFFQNITNFAQLYKYFGETIKIFRKMRKKIVVSTLTALLLETPEWEAALTGRLANKPIQ
jgi:hypothetical protein